MEIKERWFGEGRDKEKRAMIFGGERSGCVGGVVELGLSVCVHPSVNAGASHF